MFRMDWFHDVSTVLCTSLLPAQRTTPGGRPLPPRRVSGSAFSVGRKGSAARSWDFLSLPNCAPEVFVHARRHVFVVRIRDVFAYRLRVLEAVTANAAMPLVAGEDVRTPLGAFRVAFGRGQDHMLGIPVGGLTSAAKLDSGVIVPAYRRCVTNPQARLRRRRCGSSVRPRGFHRRRLTGFKLN
jgi:hypothetical protein